MFPGVFMLVFGGGSALAGLAGVIGGNYLITEPSMAAHLGPIVFVVIVVGRHGLLDRGLHRLSALGRHSNLRRRDPVLR